MANEEQRRRRYAEWYGWARRNLTEDPQRAHAAAWMALQADAGGADEKATLEVAKRAAFDGHTYRYLAVQEDQGNRDYAVWFAWAALELKQEDLPTCHRAAFAAVEARARGAPVEAAMQAGAAAIGVEVPAVPAPTFSMKLPGFRARRAQSPEEAARESLSPEWLVLFERRLEHRLVRWLLVFGTGGAAGFLLAHLGGLGVGGGMVALLLCGYVPAHVFTPSKWTLLNQTYLEMTTGREG